MSLVIIGVVALPLSFAIASAAKPSHGVGLMADKASLRVSGLV
ncbi:MAG: hypothetical protein ACXW11_01885 [Methylotenera sp.]